MAGCNLHSIIQSADSCNSDYAGVGDRVYFGLISDLDVKPTVDDFIEDKNEYESDVFNSLQGKLHAIDIKQDSGQVTGEDAEGVDGYTNVGTFVIDKNLDAAAATLRGIKMLNTVWFIPDGKGKYYVLYSRTKRTKVTAPFDSGITYDSDHGHTVTITVAPCEFNECKWTPPSTKPDLDDWCADITPGSGSGSGSGE